MWQRVLPLLVFIALAGLLLAGVRLSATRDPNVLPSPLIDRPAPDFQLPTLHSPELNVSRADLLGKPYLLNVWASWCAACRLEHPLIERIANEGKIQVIGFNYKDQAADANRWLQQFGDPYAQILVDLDGRSGIEWGVYGAPETFLVDAQGIVRFKHVGPMTPDIYREQILPRIGVTP
ncbi:MAG: DsbE family thiol:disulfide interchange protein [Pseudomarimonas sp.]